MDCISNCQCDRCRERRNELKTKKEQLAQRIFLPPESQSSALEVKVPDIKKTLADEVNKLAEEAILKNGIWQNLFVKSKLTEDVVPYAPPPQFAFKPSEVKIVEVPIQTTIQVPNPRTAHQLFILGVSDHGGKDRVKKDRALPDGTRAFSREDV